MFKILIAEDDRELRQLFQHILLKNGYTVKGFRRTGSTECPGKRLL